MATLRTIRKRIRSVHSTRKITKAMKMVAAARLRRAQQKTEESAPYAKKIEELLGNLLKTVSSAEHPLLKVRPVQKRLLVILSSDRGLCGSFNASLFRKVEAELRTGVPTAVMLIGKKANQFFGKRGLEQAAAPESFWSGFSYEKASALAQQLATDVVQGTYDRVDIYHNEFLSVISQRPKLTTLAPLTRPAETEGEGQSSACLYEPSKDQLLQALLPRVVDVRFYVACLHSLASEYGARMTAMDSATRNAGEMIDDLTLLMNRIRQATITKELVEIISGAEALK